MLSRVLPVEAAEAVADDRIGAEAAAIERDSLAHTLAALDSLPDGLRGRRIFGAHACHRISLGVMMAGPCHMLRR